MCVTRVLKRASPQISGALGVSALTVDKDEMNKNHRVSKVASWSENGSVLLSMIEPMIIELTV